MKNKPIKKNNTKMILAISVILVIGMAYYGQIRFRETETELGKMKFGVFSVISALKKYHAVCGKYPTTEAGLISLKQKADCGYLPDDTIQLAKFRNEYETSFEYTSDGNDYQLISKGKKRKYIFTKDDIQTKLLNE